jgi:hypothetical protein
MSRAVCEPTALELMPLTTAQAVMPDVVVANAGSLLKTMVPKRAELMQNCGP